MLDHGDRSLVVDRELELAGAIVITRPRVELGGRSQRGPVTHPG
jgi:hypothetical protein